jgi:phosphatidate phosphatase APP1
MSNWKSKIQNIFENIDNWSDDLRFRLKKLDGYDNPLTIVPFLGYGTREKMLLSGRVLESRSPIVSSQTDSKWKNFVNLYRRFETDEVAEAKIRAVFQGVELETVTDKEGYFYFEINPAGAPGEQPFHEVELELLEPLSDEGTTFRTFGKALIPPASARFGVISDLDDTVLTTNVTNKLKMFMTVALLNEYTRMPFKGVSAFYRALQRGSSGAENNPIFYVSSSPWNLYPLLTEFLRIQEIPLGPLFLKDFGTHTLFTSSDHKSHKINNIESVLNMYPHLPFVLIGDSGEQDPEIYSEIVRKYPNRIRAVYIRNIDIQPERVAAIDKLILEVRETGSQLVLAPDTEFAAVHAAGEKLISVNELPHIREEKITDESAPTQDELETAEIPAA